MLFCFCMKRAFQVLAIYYILSAKFVKIELDWDFALGKTWLVALFIQIPVSFFFAFCLIYIACLWYAQPTA